MVDEKVGFFFNKALPFYSYVEMDFQPLQSKCNFLEKSCRNERKGGVWVSMAILHGEFTNPCEKVKLAKEKALWQAADS